MTFEQLFDVLGEQPCKDMHEDVTVLLSMAELKEIYKSLSAFLDENDREDYFCKQKLRLKLKKWKDGKLCFGIDESKKIQNTIDEKE